MKNPTLTTEQLLAKIGQQNIVSIFPGLQGLNLLRDKKRVPHASKAGPGRRHAQGDGTGKSVKQKRAGSYGKGLRNWITNKQAARAA
mgnify:CR=1 FL=1